jgi:outer membrane immunogenic protein
MRDRSTKGVFAGAVLAAAAAFASSSAQAGILDPAPAYPARFSNTALMYDWTGLYVGLNAGGSFGRVNWKSDPDLVSGNVSVSSGIAGGTIGYNVQNLGAFVAGTEFDFDWRGINATVPPPSCAPNCEFKSDWVATARLRFGRAFGGFLPYLTGGISIGDVTMDIVGQPLGTNNSVSFNWTGGAGDRQGRISLHQPHQHPLHRRVQRRPHRHGAQRERVPRRPELPAVGSVRL